MLTVLSASDAPAASFSGGTALRGGGSGGGGGSPASRESSRSERASRGRSTKVRRPVKTLLRRNASAPSSGGFPTTEDLRVDDVTTS